MYIALCEDIGYRRQSMMGRRQENADFSKNGVCVAKTVMTVNKFLLSVYEFEDIPSRMRFLEGLKDALQIKARAEKHFGMQLKRAEARIFGLQDHAPLIAKEVLNLMTNDMIYSSVAHRRNSDKTLDSVVCNLDRFLESINLKRLKKRMKNLVKNKRTAENHTKLESEAVGKTTKGSRVTHGSKLKHAENFDDTFFHYNV